MELVGKERGGLAGIRDRVVDAFPDELVVLHQAVVGVFREADRRQHERVNDGQLKQRMARGGLTENRQIEPDEIVAEDKRGFGT